MNHCGGRNSGVVTVVSCDATKRPLGIRLCSLRRYAVAPCMGIQLTSICFSAMATPAGLIFLRRLAKRDGSTTSYFTVVIVVDGPDFVLARSIDCLISAARTSA